MSDRRSALAKLTRAYNERDQATMEWKLGGGQVVGCLGSDVPEELLVAAGFLPVRICGKPGSDMKAAELYLEQGFDPLVRAQFSRIVGGAYAYLDHLIISNSSDALIRVFYYLRAIRQLEPERPIPDLYFFDFLHTPFRMSALYNRDRFRELRKVVESWRGQPIMAAELEEAIAIYNENRALLQDLQTLRNSSLVSGVEALQIIGAALFLPRCEHTRLLKEFLNEAGDLPPISGVRLFMTGSTLDHPEFYELVESCGAVIVGEDHELGSRLFTGEIDPAVDPVDGIVDHYHLRRPSSSQATISERVAALVEQVKSTAAQGVIFFIHQADDAPSWDFPEQRKALEAIGIAVLLLDRQPYEIADPIQLRKKIEAFIVSIEANHRTPTPTQSPTGSRR